MSQKDQIYKKSQDFRTVYANGIAIQFMGIDAIIKFSILDEILDPSKGGYEQVAVAMNVQNLKALGIMISALIEHHEKTSGNIIEINPMIQENIERALNR